MRAPARSSHESRFFPAQGRRWCAGVKVTSPRRSTLSCSAADSPSCAGPARWTTTSWTNSSGSSHAIPASVWAGGRCRSSTASTGRRPGRRAGRPRPLLRPLCQRGHPRVHDVVDRSSPGPTRSSPSTSPVPSAPPSADSRAPRTSSRSFAASPTGSARGPISKPEASSPAPLCNDHRHRVQRPSPHEFAQPPFLQVAEGLLCGRQREALGAAPPQSDAANRLNGKTKKPGYS